MKEFGVNIDTSSEKWTKFANNMRKANLSIPDYTKLKNTLADISKIVNSLDFGSIISDEDYEKLSAYNDEWERFFILQSDGSRKFIGDAESMKKATLENLAAQSKDLEYRKELVNNIKESKLDFEIDEYTIDKDVGGDGKDGTVSEDTVKAYNEKNGTDYTRDNIIGNVMAN